ncbi:MAG: 16S rRNA (adenine(1518)-N(6)/adenine(1519)-N(6))-dimethyltransferase RsmA [Bacteroidales bacterium]|nr:16S rRNA (adenine(1518)-N(6)/adenine(1519)-N(6))-dimethyltransferase RsmA [Bacteroidales bacterium]
MKEVRAKKFLGQHFLTDEDIALKIVDSLQNRSKVLEIGAGMGVLTKYLINRVDDFKVVEIDSESVEYLNANFRQLEGKIIEGDFLNISLNDLFCGDNFSLIGNFPYNISNLILFKVFENKFMIDEVVGMFQKEVADRIVAKQGSKTYGILSVLLSAFYDREYLFTVSNQVFNPPPKVQSAVIRLKRNNISDLGVSESDFVRVVKTSFNQRRKMLRQSLKPLQMSLEKVEQKYLTLRPEQMSKDDFIILTKEIYDV